LFAKTEQELSGLQQGYLASIVSAGKLSRQQSDWLVNEVAQKRKATTKMFTEELTKRLAAVSDNSAKRKRLVESEV